LTKLLNSLITVASKSVDWYTERATETLFDFTTEANLMTEIKDVLDELNIISCIARQQATVIKPFMRDMLNQSLDTEDTSFYDSSRMEFEIVELQKTALSTLTPIVATSIGSKAKANQCGGSTSCKKRGQSLC
jgi:hypothetical protein